MILTEDVMKEKTEETEIGVMTGIGTVTEKIVAIVTEHPIEIITRN